MEPYYQQSGMTIYNGEALDVLARMEGGQFTAVITDPPYSSGGAFRGDRMRDTTDKYQQSGTWKQYQDFTGDTRDQRAFAYWSALYLHQARRVAKPGGVLCVFTDWRQLPTTTDAVQAGGWVWRGIAAWDKTEAARGIQGRMRNQCEYVVWGSSGPMPVEGVPYAGVFTHYMNPGDKEHLTQKPVEVIKWLLNAMPAGPVLDPFMGAGTTLVACKEMKRECVGIEIDRTYCEIAARRLAQEILL